MRDQTAAQAEVASQRQGSAKKMVLAVDMKELAKRVENVKHQVSTELSTIEELAKDIMASEDMKLRWLAMVEAVQDRLRGTISTQELIDRMNSTTLGMDDLLVDGLVSVWPKT